MGIFWNNYPALKKILADIELPLFAGAEVEVECWSDTEDGQPLFDCDPESAKLSLPEVDQATLERLGLPKRYTLEVKHFFEDNQARSAWFYFTFVVNITEAKQRPDGMFDLQYTSTVKHWNYLT